MSQRQPSTDTSSPAGYEATCVDERRLGDTVEATLRRYDDGDILIFDSAQTESPTSTSHGAGVVILAPAQAIGFVRLVRRYRPLSAEGDPHVGHLPRETRCSLGVDQLGEEVVVERRSTTEIHFSSLGGRQACCLSADQAQDLYEYLGDIGCNRRPGGSGAPAAAADTAVGTVPEPTVDPAAADWAPGDPCPGCGHQTVHAVVRAGMRWHADGGWNFDETLAIYEAFCPDCDWLPPVADSPGHPSERVQ